MRINLVELYEQAKAAELEKVAEQTPEQNPELTDEEKEQMEVIAAYAASADALLAQEYGDDYNEEDVEKLASLMIEHDANLPDETEEEVAYEKVAEAHQLGIVQARAFAEELIRLSSEEG